MPAIRPSASNTVNGSIDPAFWRPRRRSISLSIVSGEGIAVYKSRHSSPSFTASNRPSRCASASGARRACAPVKLTGSGHGTGNVLHEKRLALLSPGTAVAAERRLTGQEWFARLRLRAPWAWRAGLRRPLGAPRALRAAAFDLPLRLRRVEGEGAGIVAAGKLPPRCAARLDRWMGVEDIGESDARIVDAHLHHRRVGARQFAAAFDLAQRRDHGVGVLGQFDGT